MSRRNFLRATAVTAAAAGTMAQWSLPEAASAAEAPFVPYTPDSYFRKPVAGLPVDATRTASFRTFMKTNPDQRSVTYPTITGQGTNPWGTTEHVGVATDPIWKLRNPTTDTKILATQGWHMADSVADRIPTGTQDRPFLIVDRIFGYSLFCGDVVPDKSTRTITVGASAIFWHSSNGLDRRNPRTNDKRNYCSRGRIPDAMLIRPDLVRSGIANGTGLGHVLQMFLVATDARTFGTGYVHPMVGCEQRHIDGWGAEGERIAIRPDLDLKSRGLTDAALVVARTLQQHGAYIGDNSGSGSTLKGAQSTATYKPYAGTNLTRDCLKGKITWDDFVVIAS
jgi:hypothetical protein